MMHLAQIVKEEFFADEDILLFCDDDELVLRTPEGLEKLLIGEIPAIRCIQHLEENESSTFAEVKECEASGLMNKSCQVVTDFTGYMTRVVKEFFANYKAPSADRTSGSDVISGLCRVKDILHRARDRLGDTDLMRIMDNEGSYVPSLPFVWHRVRGRLERISHGRCGAGAPAGRREQEHGIATARD